MMRASLFITVLLLLASPCVAWLAPGHMKATRVAMEAMKRTDLPPFFRAGANAIARETAMPDILRNRAVPELYAAERSEHYFDLELLEDNDLPPTRPQFIALCHKLGVEPGKVGYLPYAIVETTQRLAIAFADYRWHRDDPAIQARCIAIAGELAHYAQDLAQPLHVTVHFDGRGKPGSGIHKRMDALLHRVDTPVSNIELERHTTIAVADLLSPIRASNALVDRVYELEAHLPTDDDTWQPTPDIKALAADRLNTAAFLTCTCILTAWDLSATIRLPDWTPAP